MHCCQLMLCQREGASQSQASEVLLESEEVNANSTSNRKILCMQKAFDKQEHEEFNSKP